MFICTYRKKTAVEIEFLGVCDAAGNLIEAHEFRPLKRGGGHQRNEELMTAPSNAK